MRQVNALTVPMSSPAAKMPCRATGGGTIGRQYFSWAVLGVRARL